jgi:flagellar biosynthetic protein FlhB
VQGQLAAVALEFAKLVGPPVLAILGTGMLAGAMQTRFKATPEALGFNWGRINPMTGFKQVFGVGKVVPTFLGVVKLAVVLLLSYSVIKGIVSDPIFFHSVNVARIAGFMAETTSTIGYRVVLALGVIAAIDYGYQLWKTNKDMLMSREEVKDEAKSQDGNPHMKGRMRSKRMKMSQRKMMADVATADVVVTNPTHIAVALRYDRKTMKAPKIVAKGVRLNAEKIREIARQHGVPLLENKPLARAMFKYGRIGGEIPAQLFTAVAEVLAWVYRVNAYRYYREQHS